MDLGVLHQGDILRGRDGGFSGLVANTPVWVFGDSVFTVANAEGKTWLGSSWATADEVTTENPLPELALGADALGLPLELLPYTRNERQFNTMHAGEDLSDSTLPSPLCRLARPDCPRCRTTSELTVLWQ